jgi:hypothetical protein
MRYKEFAEDKSLGYATSKHGTRLHNREKREKIQPGTKDWFKLWFARPFLTHEKPPKKK